MAVVYPLAGVRPHVRRPFNVYVIAEVGTRIDFTNLSTNTQRLIILSICPSNSHATSNMLTQKMDIIFTYRKKLLSRHQTIDKVGQLFGRGLLSEDNQLMKSLNHDTCHLSRHDCDVKKWQTIRTPTLLCCFIF